MSKIINRTTYTSRMTRAMFDKLFFIDKVDATLFVDYGCADGSLLASMNQILTEEDKDFLFMGYDNDHDMIKEAEKTFDENSNMIFTYNWESVENNLIHTQNKSALILSSIIHEVYHYSDVNAIDYFWDRVFSSGFDYIIIRDMIPSNTVDRSSDVNDIMKVRREFHNTKPLMDFEKTWGSISNNKNLVHFLLKYKYVEPNWDREVKENYLPIYEEDLLSLVPKQYKVLFNHHFVLPYTKEQVLRDFEIDIKDNTHLKLILKNNE